MNENNLFHNPPLNLVNNESKDQKSLEDLLNKRNPQIDVQELFQDAYFEEFLSNIH